MSLEKFYSFYNGKKVLVTGHTGFKGSWLCLILNCLGAKVYGYALEPPTTPSAFTLLNVSRRVCSKTGDVRDFSSLYRYVDEVSPEIVFHLAAQPLVRESYLFPRETYETNVMGTINILECIRNNGSIESFLNITTDKVYENNDCIGYAFKEDDKLDGYDPYSNSKSCSELVTHSYKKSFFERSGTALSTARAGNVIGGGDFAKDRIIPDCVRAVTEGQPIAIRNPYSVRPYQHVLEPLFAYLMIAMLQVQDHRYAGYYNIGPDDGDCITTSALADLFVKFWGDNSEWRNCAEQNAPHEANYLRLDCSKIRQKCKWHPVWNVQNAVKNSVAWYKAWFEHDDVEALTLKQIIDFGNNI